jgi:hypothetical protein
MSDTARSPIKASMQNAAVDVDRLAAEERALKRELARVQREYEAAFQRWFALLTERTRERNREAP